MLRIPSRAAPPTPPTLPTAQTMGSAPQPIAPSKAPHAPARLMTQSRLPRARAQPATRLARTEQARLPSVVHRGRAASRRVGRAHSRLLSVWEEASFRLV